MNTRTPAQAISAQIFLLMPIYYCFTWEPPFTTYKVRVFSHFTHIHTHKEGLPHAPPNTQARTHHTTVLSHTPLSTAPKQTPTRVCMYHPPHTRRQTEFIGYLLPYFLTAILPTMIGLGWRKINPDLVRHSRSRRRPRRFCTTPTRWSSLPPPPHAHTHTHPHPL